jgi:hypothetical protein
MHYFDHDTLSWTDISENMTGVIPEKGYYHGMASLVGNIYVFGGWSKSGAFGFVFQ